MSSSSSKTSASSQEDAKEDVKEEAKTSTSTTSIDPQLSLHDYLSLGEVELGLSSENPPGEEIQRLPFFLRVLSLTRPLSSIGILGDEEKEDGDDPPDPVVNQVVARLEHVAATYNVAEGVDVVTCHLAPSMSRKLSKLSPLQKQNEVWNTQALTAVAKHPTTSRSKRRRSSMIEKPISATNSAEYSEDGIQGSSDQGSEQDDDVDEEEEAPQTLEDFPSKKRKLGTSQRRDSLGENRAAEDSQEATVTKTLSELASLVASSLEPLCKDVDDSQGGGSKGQKLSLTIDDSILSERGTDEGVGGAMAGSDLGSTVAAIMHHAPVLRSRHVANALCRATIPQAGELMTRMGANCPASVPSLLRGCIEAYSAAIVHGNTSIANVAKQGIMALSELSTREQSRVQAALLTSGVMMDVQLKLSMAHDPTSAVCLLVQHLSNDQNALPSDMLNSQQQSVQEKTQQPSGENSSDFRSREREYGPITRGKEPTLIQLLQDSPALLKHTLEFLKTELSKAAKSSEKGMPKGRLCLLFKACGWVMLRSPINTSSRAAGGIATLLEAMVPELQSLLLVFKKALPEQEAPPEESALDRAFALLYCAIILTLARLFQIRQTEETVGKSFALTEDMLSFRSISRRSDGLISRIICLLKNSNSFALYTDIMETLTDRKSQDQGRLRISFLAIESGLQSLCDKAKKDNMDVEGEKVSCENASDSLSTLLLEVQEELDITDDTTVPRTKKMLKTILTDDADTASSLVCRDDVARFVTDATAFLSRSKELVPTIMPVQIEALGSKVEFGKRDCSQPLNGMESKFLLQLLHAFEYLEREPKSPFAFDPRDLPIKESLFICKNLSSAGKAKLLNSRLLDLVEKHCPEILLQVQKWELQRTSSALALKKVMSRRETGEVLGATIRACIQDANPDEPAANLEGLFLFAQSQLPDSDLCTKVVSSLLSTPNKPPPFYTYALLCRDPLVLLKCPMKVWTCRGLRRMTLTVLCSLLETNAVLIFSTSRSEESAVELIAARNALLVRCLFVAMSGADSAVPSFYCSMTTSILRTLIAGNRGLVAVIIKQGLPDVALDWLVEYIPETMGDSQELTQLLSDRSSLTPAERLVAADAVLRIAITHGQSNEIDAEAMVYSALSQLINSFFLVVGPVGVPVNVLIGDGSGLDVTQMSRKAAFRILKSLLKVRGRRVRMRNECGMALQKLASLCKGESAVSGVAGAVAGRRKALLKEIFDAVTKAINSMGSTIGSQSMAA